MRVTLSPIRLEAHRLLLLWIIQHIKQLPNISQCALERRMRARIRQLLAFQPDAAPISQTGYELLSSQDDTSFRNLFFRLIYFVLFIIIAIILRNSTINCNENGGYHT